MHDRRRDAFRFRATRSLIPGLILAVAAVGCQPAGPDPAAIAEGDAPSDRSEAMADPESTRPTPIATADVAARPGDASDDAPAVSADDPDIVPGAGSDASIGSSGASITGDAGADADADAAPTADTTDAADAAAAAATPDTSAAADTGSAADDDAPLAEPGADADPRPDADSDAGAPRDPMPDPPRPDELGRPWPADGAVERFLDPSLEREPSAAPTHRILPAVPRGAAAVFPQITVDPVRDGQLGRVVVAATVAMDIGWLEQAVCKTWTRDHESLLVTDALPSHIHAALLAAGFEPGRPGGWRMLEDRSLQLEPPTGSPLHLAVAWADPDDGSIHAVDLADWIVLEDGSAAPDVGRFRFAGSLLMDERGEAIEPTIEPGDETADARYVADATGSIVGLVTFGDEAIGLASVRPHDESLAPLTWIANTPVMPASGTPAFLIITAGEASP